jgi:hypothetical protein
MLYYIYKLVCKTCPEYSYVGHTKRLQDRTSKHRADSLKGMSKLYTTIRDTGGWDNWELIVIDKIECEDAYGAKEKEEEFRVLLNASLNTQRCFVSTEQKDLDKIKNKLCECGKYYSFNTRSIHFNTYYHKNFITNKNN